jgi:hypothetical protein
MLFSWAIIESSEQVHAAAPTKMQKEIFSFLKQPYFRDQPYFKAPSWHRRTVAVNRHDMKKPAN